MPHLVIARGKGSLSWLVDLPPSWRVTVYNTGDAIETTDVVVSVREQRCPATLTDAALRVEAVLATLANTSQVADVTVFCPANPFDDAPDFLDLLARHERFGDVQPLSTGTAVARSLAEADGRDWIDDLPVRAERHSLRTLAPLSLDDDSALRAGRAYRRKHGLGGGSHLTAHFLRLIGLSELADQAEHADIGLHAHGGIFAVRQAAMRATQARCGSQLASLRVLASADTNYPDVIERCWLHLFGLPFTSLAGLATAPRAVQQAAAAPTMSRVVASIDAVLAQAGPARQRDIAPTFTLPLAATTTRVAMPVLSTADIVPPDALPSVLRARELAQLAMAQNDLRAAWQHLDTALRQSPDDIDLLADITALAYREGDNQRALNCARRALAVDPNHLDCLYTLGMCLAATGQTEQAMEVLDRLAGHPETAHWQAELATLDGGYRQAMDDATPAEIPSLLGPRAVAQREAA